MDEENQIISFEKEVIELKKQYLQLNQQLETVKKLFQQRRISPTQFLLITKLLIVILVGINAQNGKIQFSGEQILPMVETLTSSEEVETNF